MWKIWIGVSMSAGLYLAFWMILRSRWLAVGCSIFWLSDSGTCCYFAHPLIDHLRRVASALIRHRHSLLNLAPQPLLQLNAPDPGVILPFALFQLAAILYARERQGRYVILLPGLIFALTFYLYFYLWTAIAAGLVIAFMLDRSRRRLYLATLAIGAAAGLPELVRNWYQSTLVSHQALQRFGLMVPATAFDRLPVPYAGLAMLTACAALIWYRRKWSLIFPWSFAAGAMLLSRSSAITGIGIHEYHWDWFWQPILAIVLTAVVIDAIRGKPQSPRVAICAGWVLVAVYFAGGLYLTVQAATRTPISSVMLVSFSHYQTQRMTPHAPPLVAGSIIAGAEDFCDLSVIDEGQRALDGFALSRSFSLDDAGWRARMALNAYLRGLSPAQFKRHVLNQEYWGPLPAISPATVAAFMLEYAAVARDPASLIDAYRVRYLALPTSRPPPPCGSIRWTLIQSGPYWDLWQKN